MKRKVPATKKAKGLTASDPFGKKKVPQRLYYLGFAKRKVKSKGGVLLLPLSCYPMGSRKVNLWWLQGGG